MRLSATRLTAIAQAIKILGNLDQQVKDIYAAGRLGPWFDPSDLTTMYTTRNGSIPVGTPGNGTAQFVGLMLDKSQLVGPVYTLGTERWNNAAIVTAGEASIVSSGVFRIYSSSGVNSYIQCVSVLTPGLTYYVEFTIDSIAVAGAGIRIGDFGAIFTTVGLKTAFFVAESVSGVFKRMSGATDYQISNVSFKLVSINTANLGPERWTNDSAITVGEASIVSSGVFRIYSSSGAYASVTVSSALTAGLTYYVEFTIDSIAVAGIGVQLGDAGAMFNTTGQKRAFFVAESASALFKRGGRCQRLPNQQH